MERKKPTVVCLCGSTRFADAFRDAMRKETLEGKIVLSVGLFGHAEDLDMEGPTKKMLDELHLRKIDLADEVLILNAHRKWCPRCKDWRDYSHTAWPLGGGMCYDACPQCPGSQHLDMIPYIGDSTRREIAYAIANNKIVRYLHTPKSEEK